MQLQIPTESAPNLKSAPAEHTGMVAQPAVPLNETSASLQKLDSKIIKDNTDKIDNSPNPFSHLPQHEQDILRRQVEVPEVSVGYFTLFRYATFIDKCILFVSCICTVAAGAAMPLMTVCFPLALALTARLVISRVGLS